MANITSRQREDIGPFCSKKGSTQEFCRVEMDPPLSAQSKRAPSRYEPLRRCSPRAPTGSRVHQG